MVATVQKKEWTSGTTSAWKSTAHYIFRGRKREKRNKKKRLENKVKRKKKKKNYKEGVRGVDVSGEDVAGQQGWGQGRVVGMVQKSSTPSLIFPFFCFFENHSLHHTTRHCFSFFLLSDRGRKLQGHQKLCIDHWTIGSADARPALEEGGCLPCLRATLQLQLQFTPEGGGKKKNPDAHRLSIFEERRQCVLLYARLLCQ